MAGVVNRTSENVMLLNKASQTSVDLKTIMHDVPQVNAVARQAFVEQEKTFVPIRIANSSLVLAILIRHLLGHLHRMIRDLHSGMSVITMTCTPVQRRTLWH